MLAAMATARIGGPRSEFSARQLVVAAGFVGALTTGSTAWAQPALPAPPPQDTAPVQRVAPEPTGPAPTAAAPPATAEPTPTQPSPQPTPTPTPDTTTTSPPPAVDDSAWSALEGRQVIVETGGGTVEGELLRSDGQSLVLVLADGRVETVPKASATGVRVAPAANPTPAAEPVPASKPSKRRRANEATDESGSAEDEPSEEDEELTPGQQRRKDRREKREHALLGAFTMHGATYSHWRGDGVNSGHASYAMDWGIGANLSPKFGMYAMAGGLFGAKLDSGETKANYGHIAGLFVFGGKYYYSTIGAGVAFSRLRFADDTLQKDRGLALPFKLVGKIPLPKKMYIGIGLTYELALVRGFGRAVNAIGGQIVVGRW